MWNDRWCRRVLDWIEKMGNNALMFYSTSVKEKKGEKNVNYL